MNTAIELHDSELAEIVCIEDSIKLSLRPAYVHISEGRPGSDQGVGCNQDVVIVISSASTATTNLREGTPIWEGYLRAGNHVYTNLIPIRSSFETPVELRLVLVTGDIILINGERIVVDLEGPAGFVEKFNP